MLFRKERIAPVSALVFASLLAGCGGSGRGASGGPAQPSQIVVRLNNRTVRFAAFQDGSAAWKVVAPSAGVITQTVTDPGGRFGVVLVEGDVSVTVSVFQSTLAEERTFELAPRLGFQQLTGAVTGLAADRGLVISTPGIGGNTIPENENYSVTMRRRQPWDLFAAFRSPTETISVDARRNLDDVANPVVNFDAAQPTFRPAEHFTIQLRGAANAGGLAGGVTLLTKNGTTVFLGGGRADNASFYALNPSQRVTTDRYQYAAQSFTGSSFAEFDLFKADPVNTELTAPDVAEPAVVTMQPAGNNWLAHVTWRPSPEAQLHRLEFDSLLASYEFFTTNGALAPGSQKSFTSPDFSVLPGWDPAWNMLETPDFWTIQSIASNLGIHDQITPPSPIPAGARATTWTTVPPAASLNRTGGSRHPMLGLLGGYGAGNVDKLR